MEARESGQQETSKLTTEFVNWVKEIADLGRKSNTNIEAVLSSTGEVPYPGVTRKQLLEKLNNFQSVNPGGDIEKEVLEIINKLKEQNPMFGGYNTGVVLEALNHLENLIK